MHEHPEQPQPVEDQGAPARYRFPLPLQDELEQAARARSPIVFREGTTELSVVIETLDVREAGTPEELCTFTGRTAAGEKVKGVAIQKLDALYIEFEN